LAEYKSNPKVEEGWAKARKRLADAKAAQAKAKAKGASERSKCDAEVNAAKQEAEKWYNQL
jgi:F0F1-type ATP synthase membrane subunit b/b'